MSTETFNLAIQILNKYDSSSKSAQEAFALVLEMEKLFTAKEDK